MTRASDVQKIISLITSPQPTTAAQLGWIVSKLIKYEHAPGGPYILFEDSAKNVAINKKIAAFIAHQTSPQPQHANKPIDARYKRMLHDRYASARAHIDSLPRTLSASLLGTLKSVESADLHGEIALLSTLFYDSYRQGDSLKVGLRRLAKQLDVANILVWVSYSIYDDAIDENSTKALQKLPAASALLRTTVSLFKDDEHRKIINALLHDVDTAMTEELNRRHDPRPQHTVLFDAMGQKSIAHITGPLILTQLLCPNYTPEIHLALQQYCAARQLLDDLYDWQEDLAKKQITYVTAQLTEGATVNDQHHIKRRLMEEVLKMSTTTTRTVNKLLCNPSKDCLVSTPFINVTSGRITDIARQALAHDAATIDAIASYAAATRQSL